MRPATTTPLLALLLAAAPAAGDILELPAVGDNTLYESKSGALSNGAGDHFFAGLTNAGAIRRGLVRFDLTSIPPGSTVLEATLVLNMSRTISGPMPVALHRVLADWGEGGSDAIGDEGFGAPSQPGDATWIHRFFDTELWGAPGGDFVPAASAVTLVGDEGVYEWSSAELAADVQAWIDEADGNFGWIVVGDEGQTPSAKRFDTREHPDPADRPVLVLDVQVVPVELLSFSVD